MEGLALSVSKILPRVPPAKMLAGLKAKTFGTHPGAEPSTPATSRKCYFTAATGTAFTVPADTEVTFDDSTWLDTSGTIPAGAKWWKCRFTSSASYETPLTKTPTLVVHGDDYDGNPVVGLPDIGAFEYQG